MIWDSRFEISLIWESTALMFNGFFRLNWSEIRFNWNSRGLRRFKLVGRGQSKQMSVLDSWTLYKHQLGYELILDDGADKASTDFPEIALPSTWGSCLLFEASLEKRSFTVTEKAPESQTQLIAKARSLSLTLSRQFASRAGDSSDLKFNGPFCDVQIRRGTLSAWSEVGFLVIIVLCISHILSRHQSRQDLQCRGANLHLSQQRIAFQLQKTQIFPSPNEICRHCVVWSSDMAAVSDKESQHDATWNRNVSGQKNR